MNNAVQDFRKISVLPAFVDKSLLIKKIVTSAHRQFLVTTPHRFGKSVNLSMLKYFFEILENEEELQRNRALFNNLLIGKEKYIMDKYFGKHLVLFLSLDPKQCGSSYKGIFDFICLVTRRAYREHAYLSKSDKLEDYEKEECAKWCRIDFWTNPVETEQFIYEALRTLVKYLKKHWKRNVIVLIDQYDAICSGSILYIEDMPQRKIGRRHCKATKEIEDIIALSEGTISALLKSNDDVERGFLTGISYLTSKGLSKLNNIREIKFQEDSEFAPFYGITVDECKNLLSKFNLDSHLDEVKEYYDGYRNNVLSIFSVVNYLNTKTTRTALQNYWRESGRIAGFNDVLKIIRARTIILKLLNDDPCNEIEIQY